jgi:hypothetical protein
LSLSSAWHTKSPYRLPLANQEGKGGHPRQCNAVLPHQCLYSHDWAHDKALLHVCLLALSKKVSSASLVQLLHDILVPRYMDLVSTPPRRPGSSVHGSGKRAKSRSPYRSPDGGFPRTRSRYHRYELDKRPRRQWFKTS